MELVQYSGCFGCLGMSQSAVQRAFLPRPGEAFSCCGPGLKTSEMLGSMHCAWLAVTAGEKNEVVLRVSGGRQGTRMGCRAAGNGGNLESARRDAPAGYLSGRHAATVHSDGDELSTSGSVSAAEEGEIMTAMGKLLKQRRAQEATSKAALRRWEESSSNLESPPLIQKMKRETHDDILFSVDARELINNNKIEKTDKEEVYLRKYLKVRRDNVVEVLKKSMLEAKFSPTYTDEVVPTLPSFIDQVIVEAVGLKKHPQYKGLDFKQRAKAYIAQTGVIPLIRKLKHNGITFPRIGYLICIAGDRLDVIVPRLEWLKSVHVRGRDLGVVLTRVPRVLTSPVDELEATVAMLEQAGVKREWMGMVISRTPGVLAVSRQELYERVEFFRQLGMSPEKYGAMVFNFPAALGKMTVEEVRPKVACLTGILCDDAAVARVIAERPQLLACSVEDGWTPLIKYFYYLGIDIFGIRRILACNPAVFCLNIQANIAPKVRFLRAIGVHEEAIGQVLVKFPAFFSYSLDKKIRPLVRFLLENVGVSEQDVGKVVATRPDLFGNSISKKLEPIVKFFWYIGIKRSRLGPMVANFPMLLKYNYPVIHPKYRYLKRVMLRPMEELVAFPRYFSYSLPSRIIPRHKLLSQKGLKFSLRYMLACSDSIFAQRVEAAERGYIPDDAQVPETPEYSTDEDDSEVDEEWEEVYVVPAESDLDTISPS